MSVFRHTLALCWRVAPVVTVLNVLLIAVMSGAAVLTAASQRMLIDGAQSGTTGAVVVAAGLGVLAHAGSFLLGRIQGELNQDLTVRVGRELDLEVLTQAASIPTLEHLERPDFLDRVTNLRRGTMPLVRSVWAGAGLIGTTLGLVASAWLLTEIHPALPLLAGFSVPLLILIARGARHRERVRDRTAESDRHERRLHQLCLTPEPAKELRIAGSGPELSRRASRLWEHITGEIVRSRLYAGGLEAIGWVLLFAALGVSLLLVLGLWREGRATVGDVVLLITLITSLSGQIERLVGNYSMMAEGGHVSGHYRWLREHGARAAGTRPAPRALSDGIGLRGVSFTYPGTPEAVLDGIDLDLPAGTTTALVGLNGAGKTTLVKLLTGMYRPDTGTVLIDGVPLDDIDPREWARCGGGVFQDFARLEMLARENVGVGDLDRLDDPAAVRDAVDRAGAGAVADGLPEGLDSQLGTQFQGTELSYGQWQKLALARGVMRRRPLLLVLDEPTSALDPQAEHELFVRFTEQAREAAAAHGAITVIVSHRFSTVNMADQIVVVENGRISERGTHAGLLAAGGRYAGLYRSQAAAYDAG
ncbi:ABC transporter ATP-binding protein [Paractinoplanes rishiriensis]|uniref:ABC transporter permease n=1 Tax=Paractinoplanes rishiriensis TaxID=1050105 RepID=A0A919JYB3_9ACTN|nr:ABC transporter ATP-binding protein [Actinoplanes rishiriensis]GIE95464.1 ABC transporter permease [Actinoplanes rishiriensis]